MISANNIEQTLSENNPLAIAKLYRQVFNTDIDRRCSSCLRDAKVRLQSRVNELKRELEPIILYVNPSPQHPAYEECLWQNQHNPHISKVVEITTPHATFQDFFNQFENNALNIIVSPDIFFDHTLHLAKQLKPNQCYALTPYHWHGDSTATLSTQTLPAALLFRGRIKKKLPADYPITETGSIESMQKEIKNAGYIISDPCRTVHVLRYIIE